MANLATTAPNIVQIFLLAKMLTKILVCLYISNAHLSYLSDFIDELILNWYLQGQWIKDDY